MKTLTKLGASLAGAMVLGALATSPAQGQTFDSILQGLSPADWWKFDETTPSPVPNTVSNSGTAANGTGYVVGQVTLGAPGVVGTGVFLSNAGQGTGNCSARIDIPNSPAFNPQPPFSIEFWAKPNAPYAPSDSTGLAPVSSIDINGSGGFEGSRSGYIFYATPTSWTMRIGGLASYSAICSASTTVSTANFTHIVGEFDGSTVYLYINGVLSATAPVTGGPFNPNNMFPTRIGGSTLPGSEYEDGNGNVLVGSGNRGWDGWVDEFAVYNTILSSNTVAAHYTAGTTSPSTYHALVQASSPVGYWGLDEPAYVTPTPSNTVAADSGFLADTGTNTLGALDDQPGVAGTGDPSVFYNGSLGSLVLDPSVTNLLDVQGTPLTLAAWIKPLTFGNIGNIIAQGYDEKTYAETFLRTGDSFDWAYFNPNNSGGDYNTNILPNVEYYEVGSYDAGPGYVSAAFPAPPGDIGNWVFLVGTCDLTNWNLYRNGALVAQFPAAWPDGTAAGPALVDLPWAVGSRSNPNQYFGLFFTGDIAEPVILTNALDPITISNLYQTATLPPAITAPPIAPAASYLGASASFDVWAEAPGVLGYQWYNDGVAIAGQTGTNLTLTSLTAAADGTYSVVVTNAYGSVTSSVVLVVTPTLPPVTLVPATETRWVGFPLSFAPASLPNQALAFQWQLNGSAIPGATLSSYTAPAVSGAVGTYTLLISNSFGASTSSMSTLSLKTAPNDYVSTILADRPLSYFRLDESAGPTAYDYAGGNDGTYVGDVTLGVPGYSLVDTDTAVAFPGTSLSYVGDIGPTAINFSGAAEFTIEAWANGPASQISGAAVVAKGHSNNGTEANEQFALAVSGGDYQFFVRDNKSDQAAATATTGPDGTWHYLAGVCDLANGVVTLYIDGIQAAQSSTSPLDAQGVINQTDPVSIGSESSEPGPTYDLAYDGTIDEVAIYPAALSAITVSNHYAAAYGTNLAPFITSEPVSVTTYQGFPFSLTVAAAGSVPLTYQWNQNGAPISGATAATYAVASPSSSDNGTYTVSIVNGVGSTNSTPVTVTVLAPPTTPPSISGLVLHLTFDNTLADSSGHGNNATFMTAGYTNSPNTPPSGPQFANGGPVGDGVAFAYETDVDPSTNGGGYTNSYYASLGYRPDLQFGSNISFSVSFWIQLPVDYGDDETSYYGNDLPFFTDTIGSTFGTGYVFAPSFGGPTSDFPGGYGYSIGGTGGTVGSYGDENKLNDGAWHNLVFVVDRTASSVVAYVDGSPTAQTVEAAGNLSAVGNINVTNAATIGQDPTGLYPQGNASSPGSPIYIQDLGVWDTALTQLQVESIYLAATVNQLSFTNPAVAPTITLVKTNGLLELNWTAGTLQSATNLTGPWSAVSGATAPYTVTPTNGADFFRLTE